jgi:carbon-monoxide dehydrogenase medium subunit
MKPAQFSYHRPETLAHAIGVLGELAEEARVMAGGQSLGPMLNLRLAQPRHVVDISRLDELSRAVTEVDMLAIGACVTHAQIEDEKIVDVTLGLLPHVARGIAYRAVRNRGTIGGSLAHADPAADWLTVMIALDASLRLRGANGPSQIRVADFVTGVLETAIGEGQLITHVLVPRLSSRACWGHAKYARKPGDFAESMAVALVDPERGASRVVLGRRSELPSIMARTSELLAEREAEKKKTPSAQMLHAAIEADLQSAHVAAADWTMHRAILLRAIRDLQA